MRTNSVKGGETHGGAAPFSSVQGSQPLSIRAATGSDVPLLKRLIHEFARFEGLEAVISENDLLRDGFGTQPRFRALIAEWEKQPAGYALFFDYYSTFRGGSGIFLEDIYVPQQFRSKGIGKALFAHLAAIALREHRVGIMFNVLDWNRKAIDFYRGMGATFLDDWKTVCLEKDTLNVLAALESHAGGEP